MAAPAFPTKAEPAAATNSGELTCLFDRNFRTGQTNDYHMLSPVVQTA